MAFPIKKGLTPAKSRVDNLVNSAAESFEVSADDVRNSRRRNASLARHHCWRTLLADGYGYNAIGRAFGRHHTTVRDFDLIDRSERRAVDAEVTRSRRTYIASKLVAAMMDTPAWPTLTDQRQIELKTLADRIAADLAPPSKTRVPQAIRQAA